MMNRLLFMKLLMQIQADQMQRRIVRPQNLETTAFGAAALAGLGVGLWQSREEIVALWKEDITFAPEPWNETLQKQRKQWDNAVERSIGWSAENG